MTKNFFAFAALMMALIASPLKAQAVTGSAYPSVVLQNQYGEKSINLQVGGSNQIDCNFVVDSSNVNGLGVSSLNGAGCAHVYMHTSQTPAVGNPNPAVGYIMVQLASNFYSYVASFYEIVSPNSGTPINISGGLTNHNAYVITSVGTSTAANWRAVGLPAGLTPAVGQSFIATTSSAGTGTGIVQVPAVASAGALAIDVIGKSSLMVAGTAGAQVLLRVLGSKGTLTMDSYTPEGTNDGGTPPIFTGTPAVLTGTIASSVQLATPADGTAIHLRFSMLPLSNHLQ